MTAQKPKGARSPSSRGKPKGAPQSAGPAKAPAPVPENVEVRRSQEIDPKDPMASGGMAPLRKIWVEAAREARDHHHVVVDLVGEGRGIAAIPVVFDDEKSAMAAMSPALDVIVRHVVEAGGASKQPVMVDLQELRERLKLEPEEDWIAEHGWLHNALSSRELLCFYVFSPSYLFEFAAAIGEKQGFEVAVAKADPGFYELKLNEKDHGIEGTILWNWARAIGDVIAGGHAWSYFGLLLAMAPQVAKVKREKKKQAKASEEE